MAQSPTSGAVKALQLELKKIVSEPIEGFQVKLVKDDTFFEWEVQSLDPLRLCVDVQTDLFHIVVMKNRQPSQKRVTDQIGSYDPLPNAHNERIIAMDFDRLKKWIALGAQTSKPVAQLRGIAGYYPIHPMTRLQAWRLQQLKTKETMTEEDQKKTEVNHKIKKHAALSLNL